MAWNPYALERTYPLLPVTLSTSRRNRVKLMALLDSGADECLFHARWAEDLGIDMKTGVLDTIGGIVPGTDIDIYYHEVYLAIGAGPPLKCKLAFSYEVNEDATDQLIGREFIFDQTRFALRQGIGSLFVTHAP